MFILIDVGSADRRLIQIIPNKPALINRGDTIDSAMRVPLDDLNTLGLLFFGAILNRLKNG